MFGLFKKKPTKEEQEAAAAAAAKAQEAAAAAKLQKEAEARGNRARIRGESQEEIRKIGPEYKSTLAVTKEIEKEYEPFGTEIRQHQDKVNNLHAQLLPIRQKWININKKLEELKTNILKSEIHLNPDYRYNYYKKIANEYVPSGQPGNYAEHPETTSIRLAEQTIKTPDNVKSIIEKYNKNNTNRNNTKKVDNTQKYKNTIRKIAPEYVTALEEAEKISKEYNSIATEIKKYDEEIKKLHTESAPIRKRWEDNNKKLEELKTKILGKEIYLNPDYRYNYYKKIANEYVPSGQPGNYAEHPETASLRIAKEKIKTPDNVLKIINKYNLNTSGGKRRKTVKRRK